MTKIAELTAYDMNNGYVRIVGVVIDSDDTRQDVEYDCPRFMVDALFAAARQEGALT